MLLSFSLQAAVEEVSSRLPVRELAAASAELTAWYRAGRPSGSFRMGDRHRLAYLVARLPATWAADVAVLSVLQALRPDLDTRSLLDLCAGPGTMLWAAAEIFPELRTATAVERDPGFVSVGRELCALAETDALRTARWVTADLKASPAHDLHDVVSISYGLGELPPPIQAEVIRNAWGATREALVVVEPGTPAGFETILSARTELLALGALIAAPCPHQKTCPLTGQERWCHFSQRLPRTRRHREVKGAELGFEDERYAYLIALRHPAAVSPAGRVLTTPRESKAFIEFEICSPAGCAETVTIARRDKSAYRQARRIRWGEIWPPRSELSEPEP